MRKIFTILMLTIVCTAFSQEKDIVNRVMFNSVNKLFLDISSDEEKELWLTELIKIESKTKDTELLDLVKEKKYSVSKLNFPRTTFDFQDISILNPKENKGYEFDFDKFKGRYFIYSKNAYRHDFILDPYISYKDGKATVFLTIRYYGNSWVFHDKVKFIINNEVIDFKVDKPDTKVLTAGKVKEYSDTRLNSDGIELLRKIANSENPIDIRFEGDKISDQVINKKVISHVKNILDFFDKFKK